MAKNQPASPLQVQIDRLEQQRIETLHGIKSQLRIAGNSLKPANIIRDAAHDIISSRDLKKLALKAAGTVAVAFILKQILQKNEKNVDEQKEQISHSESFLDRILAMLMPVVWPILEEQFISLVQRWKARGSHDPEYDDEDRDSDMAS